VVNEKRLVVQIVNASYGTGMFSIMFTKVDHEPVLSQMNPLPFFIPFLR
jgi:hypothetical protein